MEKDVVTLTDLHIRKDTGVFLLHAKYRVDHADGSIEVVDIPNIVLPFCMHCLPSLHANNFWYDSDKSTNQSPLKLYGDFGFGDSVIIPEKGTDIFYTQTVVKEPTCQEMTLDNIEKALGHPIKIVTKK